MAFIPIYHFIFYSFIILTKIYSFSILSSDQYGLTVYYVLETVLDLMYSSEWRFCYHEAYVLVGKIDAK